MKTQTEAVQTPDARPANAQPDRHELVAEADRIRAMTPGPLPDSTRLIREDRDRRNRLVSVAIC